MFQETLKEELFERGMTWKKLVSEMPTCFHYQGATFDDQAGGGRRIYPGESPMMATINVSQAAWNLAYVLAMCLTI